MTVGAFSIEGVRSLSDDEINDLATGVVEMSVDGKVVRYNKYESEAAGLAIKSVIGRNFFREIALCMDNDDVAKKYFDSEELDIIFDYVSRFE
jgi:photoactive yellow protein